MFDFDDVFDFAKKAAPYAFPVPYVTNFVTNFVATKALGLLGGDDAAPISPLGAPPAPPDLTDQAIQRAAMLQRRRQLLGQGLGSMFVSGPLGDASAPPTLQTTATGS